MYRLIDGKLAVFLAHPGGPFFAKRDDGVWSIPKGLVDRGEDRLQAAIREFREETGIAPQGEFIPLGTITQKSGKVVHAWAFEGDWDARSPITSNRFSLEWPPGSGRRQEFPEIDRAGFFPLALARQKMVAAQAALLDRLLAHLESAS